MTTISHLSPMLLVIILVTGVLLGAADEIYEQRGIKSGNGEKRPFFVGSRYGRSQSDLSNMDGAKSSRIVPRNDRFFIGSRYGKRSVPLPAVDDDNNQTLQCFYTGITNLFRCVENNYEESK